MAESRALVKGRLRVDFLVGSQFKTQARRAGHLSVSAIYRSQFDSQERPRGASALSRPMVAERAQVTVVGDPAGGFGISITFTSGVVVLGLSGEFDVASSPEIAAVLHAVIGRGHAEVVLDLSELEFIDASGLGVIAVAARILASARGFLTIRSPSEMVVRLLDITGLAEVVRVERPEALDHLGPEESAFSTAVLVQADEADIAQHLRQVTAIPADDEVVDGALRLVVALARATVGGADGVSVSLRRHGRLATVAASDQTILDMDADQYATGQGPCVDASVEGRWFHIESLDEETRWPEFVPRAKELGINAILSSPLLAATQPIGALNIYSRSAAAFAPKDQELAAIFASEASTILSDAGLAVSDEQLAGRLQEALATREVIALARGVIMERDGVTSDQAFAILRRFSKQTNMSIRERSVDIVASHDSSAFGAFGEGGEDGR